MNPHLPHFLGDELLQRVQVLLAVSVPEGLGQELLVQDVHAVVGADGVVQLGEVEAVVEVGEIVESKKDRVDPAFLR